MRSAIKLTKVFGIDIKIHVTFFLLLGLFFLVMGPRGVMLVTGVFFFVTVHELSHSLTARHFGVKVTKITLLPIGGVASMAEMPTKPAHELLISLAGPLSNVLVVLLFYWPLRMALGHDTLMYPLYVIVGRAEYPGVAGLNLLAHIYWINLVLAAFNILPAFPMDGGRVLRALLAFKMGRENATRIAVRMGHIFALLFGYLGIVHGHLLLIIIAIFIYMAASSEGLQVSFSERMKRYRVSDVLDEEFVHIAPDTPLGEVLELMLHRHQENIPVAEQGRYMGLVTRREVIEGVHGHSKEVPCERIMRKGLPVVSQADRLDRVQSLLQQHNTPALAVAKDGIVTGVVTGEDINRLFMLLNAREGRGEW